MSNICRSFLNVKILPVLFVIYDKSKLIFGDFKCIGQIIISGFFVIIWY